MPWSLESLAPLFDALLNIDQYLGAFVASYGAWVYGLLFLIVFVETGVVVMPFLPGDSLMFMVGTLAGAGLLNFPLACLVLVVAAVLGDQCNYTIGRMLGPKVFNWPHSRWFNKHAFDQAHAFYEKYGGVTVVAARFLPFIRTFAPFVAGVAEMTRSRFSMFNLVGGIGWVLSLVSLGYFVGALPWIKDNMDKIIWLMLAFPAVLLVIGVARIRQSGRQR